MIIDLIKSYDVFIIMALVVLTAIMFVFMVINDIRLSRLSKRYRKFMRGSKDKNIEELLMSILDKVDNIEDKIKEMDSLYGKMDARIKKCVQKVSMARYKAFDDIETPALSFSIAMLDEDDNGVIITGIYGRNECTTYAKSIERGVPKYDLSNEEKNVLQDAMGKRIKG